uniref:Hydroxymethylglutaryl-CoA synthase n=1 Tax=Syphacia muris TaxID=451379 RepID=A0A0N5ASI5_9BILA
MACSGGNPENVGICAMEMYFPSQYVDQTELEQFDNVSAGRYTVGLGLKEMAFCSVDEDVTSVCLTVVSALLKNYEIDKKSIGYIAVGSETLTDKSKGVFTALRSLFGENDEIFGSECIGACYAGTSALFNAVDWIYFYNLLGKYAIVVMADIAIYASGPARCTGGAGGFAALVGPDAAIAFDLGLRSAVLRDVWDFYKPVCGVSSEYAVVDGKLSLETYLSMLDVAYLRYRKRTSEQTSIASFDAVMLHCPFSKLVRKAFGRLVFADYLKGFKKDVINPESMDSMKNLNLENTYTDRQFVAVTVACSENLWQKKTNPNLHFNVRIGNMYTSSLYAQLNTIEHLVRSKVLFFSYGSGASAAMFSALIRRSKFNSSLYAKLYFNAIKFCLFFFSIEVLSMCLFILMFYLKSLIFYLN